MTDWKEKPYPFPRNLTFLNYRWLLRTSRKRPVVPQDHVGQLLALAVHPEGKTGSSTRDAKLTANGSSIKRKAALTWYLLVRSLTRDVDKELKKHQVYFPGGSIIAIFLHRRNVQAL